MTYNKSSRCWRESEIYHDAHDDHNDGRNVRYDQEVESARNFRIPCQLLAQRHRLQ